MFVFRKFRLRVCGYLSRTIDYAVRSILTFIVLLAITTISFPPTRTHGIGRLNTARSTRITTATFCLLPDSMATLEDHRGNGCCAHARKTLSETNRTQRVWGNLLEVSCGLVTRKGERIVSCG